MQVRTDRASNVDFSEYRTFAWSDPLPISNPQAALLAPWVKKDVEEKLAEKGLKPALTSSPDLLIAYAPSSDDLTLLFVDARTKEIVWRGTAENFFNGEGAERQISEAVGEILEKYPSA